MARIMSRDWKLISLEQAKKDGEGFEILGRRTETEYEVRCLVCNGERFFSKKFRGDPADHAAACAVMSRPRGRTRRGWYG